MTLDRYLFKEVGGPFLLGLGALTSIFLINQMVRLSDLFVGRGLTLLALGKLLAVLLPPFLLVTLPAALLLAGIVAFARMSADSELVALKAAGFSFGRLLFPVVLFAVLVSTAALVVGITTEPWGKGKLKQVALETVKSHTGVVITPGIFNNLFGDVLIYAERADSEGKLGGIFITDGRDPEHPLLVTSASGELTRSADGEHVGFRLHGGEIHRVGDTVQRVRFATYDIRLHIEGGGGVVFSGIDEIRSELERLKGEGQPVGHLLRLWMDHTKNVTFGVACLVFGLLGPALGVHTVRSGRVGGFATGVVVILIYYSMLTVAQSLAIGERLSVPVAAWLPNGLFALFTVWALFRVHMERPLLPRWMSWGG